MDKLLNSLSPEEGLFDRRKRKDFETQFCTKFITYALEDWAFTPESANELFLKHLETKNLKAF